MGECLSFPIVVADTSFLLARFQLPVVQIKQNSSWLSNHLASLIYYQSSQIPVGQGIQIVSLTLLPTSIIMSTLFL